MIRKEIKHKRTTFYDNYSNFISYSSENILENSYENVGSVCYSAESGLKSRLKHFESRPSFMFAFLFFLIEV